MFPQEKSTCDRFEYSSHRTKLWESSTWKNLRKIFLTQCFNRAEKAQTEYHFGRIQGCKFASDFRSKRRRSESEAKFSLSLRFRSRICENRRFRFAFALGFWRLSLSLRFRSAKICSLIFAFFAFALSEHWANLWERYVNFRSIRCRSERIRSE